MMKKLLFIAVVTSLISLPTGCGKGDDIFKKSGAGKSEASFDATYTNQTVYFDSSDANKEVTSVDAEKNTYKFKNSSEKAKQIKKGDIILIDGKAFGKADKITTQGSEIVVEVVEATLNELIEDGTIEWSTYCDFRPETNYSVQMGDQTFFPTKAGNEAKFDFSYGGYKYSIVLDLKKEYANVKMEVTKNLAGSTVKGKFIVEGRISSFYSNNKIVYQKSKLKEFSNTNDNLQGELTLSIVVAGSGNDAINLEMPVILGAYPLMVGPIPTVIKLKMQVVVNAVVPMDGSAQVSAKFKYDSQTGIIYDGLKTDVKGKIGNYSIDKKQTETGASSAIAVNFGIGFPRIEVGIFNSVVVPWVQTAFLIGGDYTSFPACRQAKAQFIGSCGIDFSFLGFTHKENKNIWQKEEVLFKTGDCR